MSYFRTNRDQEALIDFSKAIELNPNEASYWLNRARLESKLGMTEQANYDIAVGQKLLSQAPQGN